MNKKFIIGIDPGKNGGLVALSNGKIVSLAKMPQSPEELVEHFIFLGFPNIRHNVDVRLVIEDVHSMPTDGSRQAFTFGRGVGQIEGVLASFNITPIKVRPQVWQAYFKLKRDSDESKYDYKKRIKSKAISLSKTKKLSLETADAYLIALWYHKTSK